MPSDFPNLLADNLRDLGRILPELLVAAGFICGLVFDLAVARERKRSTGYVLALFLLAALWTNVLDLNALTGSAGPAPRVFAGMMVPDAFAAFFKCLLLVGTLLSLLAALHARELEGPRLGEFCLLLAAVCLGGMFLASASNLLMIYLAVEMLSIPSYALAGWLRQDRRSSEAGIKYVLYGAMSSALMLFGLSYLYGLAGTLDLAGAAAEWRRVCAAESFAAARGPLAATLALLGAGFLYKIAAAPFHFWSPDVYEGSPTTATAFFSVVPKAAGFAVLARAAAEFFPCGENAQRLAEPAFTWLAVLTMTLGNLAALGQNNAKRMLAYSSIAHSGYLLAALAVADAPRDASPWWNPSGRAALLYYLIVYLAMNFGAFLTILGMENFSGGSELKDLRGGLRRAPALGVMLLVFLFSLVGLPPLAGFAAKFLVLAGLADRSQWFLAMMIVLNTVVSLYYYLRLAKAVAMDPPPLEPVRRQAAPATYTVLAVALGAALLVLFAALRPVLDLCSRAAAR